MIAVDSAEVSAIAPRAALLVRLENRRMIQVATGAAALESVFREIDALETSPIRGTIRTRYDDHYPPWIAAALAL